LQARPQTQLQTEVPEDRRSRKTSGFEEKQTKQAEKGSAQHLKTSFSFHLHTLQQKQSLPNRPLQPQQTLAKKRQSAGADHWSSETDESSTYTVVMGLQLAFLSPYQIAYRTRKLKNLR